LCFYFQLFFLFEVFQRGLRAAKVVAMVSGGKGYEWLDPCACCVKYCAIGFCSLALISSILIPMESMTREENETY
jgi:hypothetical protein